MTPQTHHTAGMRPLVLISSLQTRGAERVTVSFLARLRQQGFEVPLGTLTRRHDGLLADDLVASGVERLDLECRRLADPVALVRLVRLLRRRRIGVVHAHGQDATILAAAACAIEGVPLIVTRHVMEEPTETVRLAWRSSLSLRALQRAERVVAVSQAVARRLVLDVKLSRPPEVVLNGIDPSFFDLGSRDPGHELRKFLGLGSGPVILSVAALAEGKGHDVLLAAAEALHGRFEELAVVLAGEGPLEDELRARAAQTGVAVHFLGHREDIPQLMSMADLVCQASLSEALPTALMEAGAIGRPVVATRVGGTEEVVDDQQTGLLVAAGDPEALAKAMECLLRDPERAARMGRVAARSARRRFSLEAQAEATVELWRQVSAPRRLAA
jgi:glycosyltransferase involved in cell wall biosynthesis